MVGYFSNLMSVWEHTIVEMPHRRASLRALWTSDYALDKVRIMPTNGASGRYITLSHCWGDPNLMNTKLTLHNLKEYTNEGISLDDLPLTFRDAVELTRSLGIPYLWIDSLCIIQADPKKDMENHSIMVREDWERESASMCAVFAGSYVTLGALTSTNCHGGLWDRAAVIVERNVTMPDGGTISLYAQELYSHFAIYPLTSRAWVYQETLLSPRTPIFLGQEVMWLCRGSLTCQCGHCARLSHHNGPDFMGAGEFCFFKLPATNTKPQSSNLFRYGDESPPWAKWHYIVQSYTQYADLTNLGDALMAIEGLADYFRRWRQGELYWGGVWSSSFAKGLLWKTTYEYHHERLRALPGTVNPKWSSEKWLFPTWSWASLSNKSPGHRRAIEYDTFRERVTEDPSGPLPFEHYPDSDFLVKPIGESLGLHDKTIDGQNTPSFPEKRRYYELRVEGVLVPISCQQLLSMDIKVGYLEPLVTLFFLCDYGRLQFSAWLEEEYPTGPPESTFYFLRMVRHVGRTGRYMALVLHCVDQARQFYERIGVLVTRYRLEKDETEESKKNWMPDWWQGAGAEDEPEPRIISLV
ncbi:heterokaryon incompatibility protein-domain-containing protein [Sordaria brevicollis]|uniref:Heterokaryon incompatibility protein-domain-containing protein n=1 Tax=Sordaria brevicollis TaxID=83679 RepID=A0AAE0UBU9_SORBR|nr:heterokaryon incompatibility protein-domain-containing protein [Sordaria brevicollis]